MSQKIGKKYTAASNQVEARPYSLEEAVPLVKSEAPLVGTGMEFRAALDSGDVVRAEKHMRVHRFLLWSVGVKAHAPNDPGMAEHAGMGEFYKPAAPLSLATIRPCDRTAGNP